MKNGLILFLMIISPLFLMGQGKVEVIKDQRINDIIRKKGEPIAPELNVMMNGFRVQLFFDSNRSQVDKMRAQFSRKYPKIETYVTYNAPNYILKVGDFRTQLEADQLKTEVSSEFPTSFVVQERINLPRID
jgi:hypothetical protein